MSSMVQDAMMQAYRRRREPAPGLMATLQPGEKSRMYALGGMARGGAFRGGYVSGKVFIALDGVHQGFGRAAGVHTGMIVESLQITRRAR